MQDSLDESARYHWAEGLKYASEGIKAFFYLNGAAAISVLTFVGNSQSGDNKIVFALFCFAIGALMGPITYLSAYLTQLHYGNSKNRTALWYHYFSYASFGFGVLLFLVGTGLAGFALLEIP